MAGGSRSAHKELAAARLATGGTVREAAEAAGVDERTVYAWKAADAEFRARITELRSQMVSGALGKLSDAMAAASDVLVKLLKNKSADVRYRAACKVLELTLKIRDATEVEERLSAVEAALRGEGRDGQSDQDAAEDAGEGDEGEPPG